MRRLLIIFAACMLTLSAHADAVSEQQAMDRAKNFLAGSISSRRGMPRSNASLQLAAIHHYRAGERLMAPSYYVFNVGEGDGFVVVSGDDRLPPVLGYAGSGTFDEATMPSNMKVWMDGYSQQMEYLATHPRAAARKVVTGNVISPMLSSKWGQRSPYNDLCPMDGDSRSVTGCLATAMGQVMYFHKWPSATVATIPGYTTEKRGFQLPAIAVGTRIAWDDIVPDYRSVETSTQQQQAIAELMLMCGTAVRMDYSSTGSGARGKIAETALKAYFGYNPSLRYEDRSDYTLEQWNRMVYDELAAGRPLLYFGQSYNGGHAFVIDGYGGDDFFHVNWGWYGNSDTYFLLSILDSDRNSGKGADTSMEGYSFFQGAIFGVQPASDGKAQELAMSTFSMSLYDGDSFTRASSSENFSFTVASDAYNLTGSSNTFDMAFGLFDVDDNLIAVGTAYETSTFDLYYGTDIIRKKMDVGAGLTSGTYKVKAISRKSGTEQWYANHCYPSCVIKAVISGNDIRLTAPVVDLTGTIEAVGGTEVLAPVTVEAVIANNGTYFCEDVYLLMDDELVGARRLEMEGGSTVTFPMTITPTTTGVKHLKLCRMGDDDYLPFATGDITVSESSVADLSLTSVVANATAGTVKEDRIVVKATVTNNGSTTYDNNIVAEFFKQIEDRPGISSYSGDVYAAVVLLPGETKDVELTFKNVTDGATYRYGLSYFSEGTLKGRINGTAVTVKIENRPQGDVNGDGEVNVTDLVPLVNMILGITESNAAADVNGDGEVNVTDLVPLVNLILNY